MRIRKQHSRPTAPLPDADAAVRDRQRDRHRHDAALRGGLVPRQITNLA